MRCVLGVDAAWTAAQPSGVALAIETETGWRLIAAESSYQRFHARADRSQLPETTGSGSIPDACGLLETSSRLCGRPVDPLAHEPIRKRRESDDAVSRAYGAKKCSTHTPNAQRPGRISDDLTSGFASCEYPLLTTCIRSPGLIEVYPHPALVELADATERLCYKAAKVAKYWPSATPQERRTRLFDVWAKIVALLDERILGVAAAMKVPSLEASGVQMKAYEDKLDAIVCAWVAICALNKLATPFGDDKSAIWIPCPAARSAPAPRASDRSDGRDVVEGGVDF